MANAKSIVGGLLAFKSEYGAYPCDATRTILEENPNDPSLEHPDLLRVGPNVLPPGNSANAYVAQLIATDNIDTEKAFFAAGMPGMREGDNLMGTSEKLLEAGENGFAYIMAKGGMPLTDTKSYTPLVLAPVKEQGENETLFDPTIYGGKLIYGCVDGSSIAADIDENGHAISKGRKSFFQTGNDSLFGKDIPTPTFPLRGTEF